MTTAHKSLLAFGELLWDVFPDGAHIGGAPFNLAAHAVRCGLDAQLLSRIGGDDLGRRALAEAHRLGVGTAFVQTDPTQPTGTVTVALDAAGQPTYTIHAPVAWDHIAPEPVAFDRLRKHRVDAICFGTLAQRGAVSRATLRQVLETFPVASVFFDVNLRQNFFTRAVIAENLARTTVLKLNDGEATVLSDLLCGARQDEAAFAREIQRRYPTVQIVLVTRGARGCLVVEHGGAATEIPGQPVQVADAVGAGDAFSAAFLASWLRGSTPLAAAAAANELGAFVASRRGAVPDYSPEIRRRLGRELQRQ